MCRHLGAAAAGLLHHPTTATMSQEQETPPRLWATVHGVDAGCREGAEDNRRMTKREDEGNERTVGPK